MQKITKLLAVFLSTFLLGGPLFAAPKAANSGRKSVTIPNQYIVVLNDGVSPSETDSIVGSHGLAKLNSFKTVLKGFSALIPPGRLKALRNDPRVKSVSADRTAYASAQTTPLGLSRIDAEPGTPANAGAGVNIAIIDSGIDRNHGHAVPGREQFNALGRSQVGEVHL